MIMQYKHNDDSSEKLHGMRIGRVFELNFRKVIAHSASVSPPNMGSNGYCKGMEGWI